MRLGSTALATGRLERRLAAILAADVAGYSRLMGADEEGTHERLKVLRRELADPKIKEHRGRIVKTTGDGLLIEFASVVDAVRCAVEVQREMAERNADVSPDRRIEFRMGINLGDIIKDGRDIYGDGVNVAGLRPFGSGSDRSGATRCEIVKPQRDGEGDDGEPGYNDCPRLGTKPFEPLCVELDRAEHCRGCDNPTAVGVCRPSPNADDDDGPSDNERDLRYM